MSRQDLDALNFTVLGEVGSQIFLSESGGEILDEEITLLLRVLEPLLLSQDNSLPLNGRKCRLHIELVSINFLVVEFLDSSLSCIETCFTILGILKAYKSKLAIRVGRVLFQIDGLDFAILSE